MNQTQRRSTIELALQNLTPTLAEVSARRFGRARYERNQARSAEERQEALATWHMLSRQGIAWFVIMWNRRHGRRRYTCLTCQLATIRQVATIGQGAYRDHARRVGHFEPYRAQVTADRDRYWRQSARTYTRPSWIPSAYGQAVLVALAAARARHEDRACRDQAGHVWGIDRMVARAEFLLTLAWGGR